jgi:APA family basic amino acid/polyamine antiporter
LPRTVKRDARRSGGYGNLYGNLLDYVISAALIFYILTILGISCSTKTADAERPTSFRLPRSALLYHHRRSVILAVLFIYQTATTWPGLIIVLTGVRFISVAEVSRRSRPNPLKPKSN